jgi:hypothetical protein
VAQGIGHIQTLIPKKKESILKKVQWAPENNVHCAIVGRNIL